MSRNIEVFINYAAIDESPVERWAVDGWRVGDSGSLSVGTWVDNEYAQGLIDVRKTYAPGQWRWVRYV